MWIETPEATKRIKIPAIDEAVDVSGDGATQVTEEVGVSLIEYCDEITEHDS